MMPSDAAPFADRASAGRLLAVELAKLQPERPIVYALPRGGVAVAVPIAIALKAPLDLLLVRKLGLPRQPELAAGAIVDGETPDIIWNQDVLRAARLRKEAFKPAIANARREIERRRALYLPLQAAPPVRHRTAILVDDGIATGASMRAAIAAMRRREPRRLIVAIPVAPREMVSDLRELVADVTCLTTPTEFEAVGDYYREFHQLSDEELISLISGGPARAKIVAVQAP